MKHTFVALILVLTVAHARAECATRLNGTNIRNQQVPGVGWAFAAVALVENQHYRETCEKLTLSVEQVIDRANSMCTTKQRNTLWCALHYMHVEGIMSEADYPYTKGIHTTQKYDRTKLAQIDVTEPYHVCLDGTIADRIDCTIAFLRNHSVASTICMDIFDLTFDFLWDIGASSRCTKTNHSIALLFSYNQTETRTIAVMFQNSSGPAWGVNGMGKFTFTNNDRRFNKDPRYILENLLSVNVTRANHTASSASASTWSSASASASTSTSDPLDSSSNTSDDDPQSSDSVKNQEVRAFPVVLVTLAAMLMHLAQ